MIWRFSLVAVSLSFFIVVVIATYLYYISNDGCSESHQPNYMVMLVIYSCPTVGFFLLIGYPTSQQKSSTHPLSSSSLNLKKYSLPITYYLLGKQKGHHVSTFNSSLGNFSFLETGIWRCGLWACYHYTTIAIYLLRICNS